MKAKKKGNTAKANKSGLAAVKLTKMRTLRPASSSGHNHNETLVHEA